MCLIALSWQSHPIYKMVLAANRDEFYERATLPAHFWKGHTQLLGGKDLAAGGTWLGITKEGKIAALTNYRDPQNIKQDAPSRGFLTSDYLLGNKKALAYLKKIKDKAADYNGFNLLLGDVDKLYYFSNYQGKIQGIRKGIHGLSNHLLNTDWYKVEQAKAQMKEFVKANEISAELLLDAFADSTKPADTSIQQTGMPFYWEKLLSSMFIKGKDYGTRCTTVILLDYFDNLTFTERVYDTQSNQFKSQTFHFKIEKELIQNLA